MKAVIYARVSTADQQCDRQLRDLQAYATRAGYEVVDTYTETASGMKNDRKERAKVIALARGRHINVVLVTELTRWGRSTLDLISTLQELHAYGVSVVAQTGLQFDLSTPQGKLIGTVLASLAEFERDLITERINSGIAAAQARGIHCGRPTGSKVIPKHRTAVLKWLSEGKSYRWIAHELHCSKDTVLKISKLANV